MNGAVAARDDLLHNFTSASHDIVDIRKLWLLSEFKLRLFEDDKWILPLLHINVISQ